jgi:flagellin
MANQDITRIASNIGAMNALWALQTINKQLGVHQSRLATGKRLNSAADDPAGLTIATKLNSRSEGLKIALSNIGDSKNLLAVAEAGVGRITDIIIQMRNKASQAASDTMGTNERAAIRQQLDAYAQQIDDIVTQTEWNGNKLIDGYYDSTALSFQTGANSSDTTSVDGLINLRATAGGTGTSLLLATKSGNNAIGGFSDNGMFLKNASEAVTSVVDNPNIDTLSTGTYTVRYTVTSTTGADDKIELLDGANNPMNISQVIGTGLGAVANSVLVDGDVDNTIDFGNGLKITVDGAKAAGTYTSTVSFVGANTYTVKAQGAAGNVLGDLAADYRTLMDTLGDTLDVVNGQMARIGAFTGRLEFKEDQVMSAQINVEASYNRIMNANMAEEQVNSSKYLILQQTAVAMLAQANQAPQTLLSLFR